MKTMNRFGFVAQLVLGLSIFAPGVDAMATGCAPSRPVYGSCVFRMPQSENGVIHSATNTTAGFAGTYSATCTNGAWTGAAGSCTPTGDYLTRTDATGTTVVAGTALVGPLPAGCAAGTTSYGSCSFSVPQTAHGAAASADTNTPGYSGSISGTCSNGRWTGVAATCTPSTTSVGPTSPLTASCPAMPVAPVGGCQFDFPPTANGGAITVMNSATGRVGQIQGACQGGAWVVGNYACQVSTANANPVSLPASNYMTRTDASGTTTVGGAPPAAAVFSDGQAYVWVEPNGKSTVVIQNGGQTVSAADWLAQGLPKPSAGAAGSYMTRTDATGTTVVEPPHATAVASTSPVEQPTAYVDVGIRYNAGAGQGTEANTSDPYLASAQRYQAGHGTAGLGAGVAYQSIVTNEQVRDARHNMRADLAAIEDDPSKTVEEKRVARQQFDRGMESIEAAVRGKQVMAMEQQSIDSSNAARAKRAAIAELKERALAELRLAGIGEGAIPMIMNRIDEEIVSIGVKSRFAGKLTMVNGRYESQSLQEVLEHTRGVMAREMVKYNLTEAEWKSRQRRGDPAVDASGRLVGERRSETSAGAAS